MNDQTCTSAVPRELLAAALYAWKRPLHLTVHWDDKTLELCRASCVRHGAEWIFFTQPGSAWVYVLTDNPFVAVQPWAGAVPKMNAAAWRAWLVENVAEVLEVSPGFRAVAARMGLLLLDDDGDGDGDGG